MLKINVVVNISVRFILQVLKNKSIQTKYAPENHSHILLNIGRDEAIINYRGANSRPRL